MQEYAETGDPIYLTPELGKRMGLTPGYLSLVPGVTHTDILEAIRAEEATRVEEGESKLDEHLVTGAVDDHNIAAGEKDGETIWHTDVDEVTALNAEIETSFGFGDAELDRMSSEAALQRLFGVASTPVANESEEAREDTRYARERAVVKLLRRTVETENGVHELIAAMRHYSHEGVADASVIHEVYREIYRAFVTLSHTPKNELTEDELQFGHNCAAALNEFAAGAKHVLGAELRFGEQNYLADRYFTDFCYRIGLTEEGHIDEDDFLPMEIAPGHLAVFSADKATMYVVDGDTATRLQKRFDEHLGSITYHEQGQYFARHQAVDVPDQVYDLIDQTIDAGKRIEDLVPESQSDPELFRDYVTLLRSNVRRVIEAEFGIELNQLNIREQLFFLNHLKHTMVEEAETMHTFTEQFGVDGMRTFLALEQEGTEFGDRIIDLAIEHPEKAKQVFHHFAQLLDRAGDAEAVLREVYPTDEPKPETVAAVESQLTARAVRMLRRAATSEDIDTVLVEIQESNQELMGTGEAFKALKGAGVVSSPEEIKLTPMTLSGAELLADSERFAAVAELYQKHYEPERAQELIEALRVQLEEPGAKVRCFYLGKTLAASVLTSDRGDRVYVGSLNVDPDPNLKPLNLGTHLIADVEERTGVHEGRTLEAVATLDNAIAYVNLNNFVATAPLAPADTGAPRFSLLRNDTWDFPGKRWRAQDVVTRYEQQANGEQMSDTIIVRCPAHEHAVPEEVGGDFVVSKFVRRGGYLYYVLEPFLVEAAASRNERAESH